MNTTGKNTALKILIQTNWLRPYPLEMAEALVEEGRLVHLNEGEWAQAEGDDRNGFFW